MPYKTILNLVLIAIILSGCGNSNSNVNANKTAQTAISDQSVANKKTIDSIALKVIVLPTADGASESDSPTTDSKDYPTVYHIAPSAFSDNVSAFGGAYSVWLGPKGWTGKADKGMDGTTRVDLFLPGHEGEGQPLISYYYIPACVGCILGEAVLYFPEADKDYREMYNSDNYDGDTSIHIPPGLKVKRISKHIATFSYPDTNNMQHTGAAYYLPSGDTDPYFMEIDCTVPPEQSQLAQWLIDGFIAAQNDTASAQ